MASQYASTRNGWNSKARAAAGKRRSRIGLGRYSHQKRGKRTSRPEVSYGEYMASEEWAAKRAMFFADTSLPKVCMGCGSPDVDLHHLTYDRLGWELLTDLAPFCRDCHRKLHRMDPDAGRKGGIFALRKSLIYDFGIGSIEVAALLRPYWPAWSKKQPKQRDRRHAHIRHRRRNSVRGAIHESATEAISVLPEPSQPIPA